MITATLKYGQLALRTSRGALDVPASRLVDDLIALAYPPETRRAAIWFDYGMTLGLIETEPSPAAARGVIKLEKELLRLIADGVPLDFLEGARAGEQGRLSSAILAHLARLEIKGPREVAAPDTEAIAAWVLMQLISEQGYAVRDCGLCDVPFISTGRSRYCRRWSPDAAWSELGQTCLDRAKVRDYRHRRKPTKQKEDTDG
jgi:hypothetical protein